MATEKRCKVPGCEATHYNGGTVDACPMHYHRARRGSTSALQPGKVKGQGTSTRRHLYLPAEIDQQLAAYVAESGRSVASAVGEALLDFFAREAVRSALQGRKGKHRADD